MKRNEDLKEYIHRQEQEKAFFNGYLLGVTVMFLIFIIFLLKL
jgi:hypothetical protein